MGYIVTSYFISPSSDDIKNGDAVENSVETYKRSYSSESRG